MAELPGTKKTLQPVYIVHSEHPLLVDRALAAVRDAAVPAAMRAWNYDVVEGKVNATRLMATCATLPMMGERRMVYVRDLAPTPADELTALVAYLDAPSPSTVLFAVTSKLDKRLKFYAAASKKGFLHVLEAPAARQLEVAPGREVDHLAALFGSRPARAAVAVAVALVAMHRLDLPRGTDAAKPSSAATRAAALLCRGDSIAARRWRSRRGIGADAKVSAS